MAARRGKSQARRNGSNGLPGWAWLVIGILVTLLVVIAAPRLLKGGDGDGFLRIGPKPNPDALPAAVDENVKLAAETLEGSNVNPVDAMVNMISLARQFEMQIKLLQTADADANKATQILSMS